MRLTMFMFATTRHLFCFAMLAITARLPFCAHIQNERARVLRVRIVQTFSENWFVFNSLVWSCGRARELKYSDGSSTRRKAIRERMGNAPFSLFTCVHPQSYICTYVYK